ncbi:MAG: hypothetical protein HN742_24975 [Lentisphaerae bacterium]|jgi:succinyl-CoA synthetase alpha subunit|nr:hypothetical protein [Lentisphaerota bacterium]MBT4814316.1 hypothetical protein [Lentisphaerota bacterium]MBT5607645.1 hypothetical protein [Lentisphaerota bacterium]MBT7054116.1 hypothetical protein [Lentisphaerota bacterium]MBT7845155.1 hypothetical protein [Lentisphaerota bacterium]
MKAKTLSDILKAGDRVAVSNVTGREASKVTEASQEYCGNTVAGWALGKGGQELCAGEGASVPVFAGFQELMESLPKRRKPNKVVVYSPPEAVYGDVKEVVQYGAGSVETVFVITEHVAIEVTAKIHLLCAEAGIDVIGCNTLGFINVHDAVRVGAVGGNSPAETFVAGSVCIISNSGNMVNTIATYLQSAGMGTSFGCSTGKDPFILTPALAFFRLAMNDPATAIVVMYIEPGGLYERELVEYLRAEEPDKPVAVYVAGVLAEGRDISLGHAGAVVDGPETSATGKMCMFDDHFGVPPLDATKGLPRSRKALEPYRRGVRVTALHDLPKAVSLLRRVLDHERDFRPKTMLKLSPWFVNYGSLARRLPRALVLDPGIMPKTYFKQAKSFSRAMMGADPPRRNMRSASHASGNDGATPRIYGRRLTGLMEDGGFGRALILAWTGEEPIHEFDGQLVEKCLIASLANGPGTISAQGAKLSTSAGNSPNTAMIAALATLGTVHGGNGAEAVGYLIRVFRTTRLTDAYEPKDIDLPGLVESQVQRFMAERAVAKEAGTDYRRIPCLGHPVYRDEEVNHDPREVVIREFVASHGVTSVFLEFFHGIALALHDKGVSRTAFAVNLDAAIASVWLGIAWPLLREKKITYQRAVDLPFLAFALGRAAGGGGEYLDHSDYGQPMDMRIPASETKAMVKDRD